MEINIEDYLSEEEIKEIAKEELARSFRSFFRTENDVERILVNLSYEYVFKLADSMWERSFEQLVKDRIKECLNSKSFSYEVFRRKDQWDNRESPAIKIMDEEIEKSRPLIKERVEEIIKKYPFHELDNEEIGYVIYDVIMDKLFGDKNNED